MRFVRGRVVVGALVLCARAGWGGEDAGLPDLTIQNFLSAGWREEFEERPHSGHALRGRLFRTRPGFLERELRVDFRAGQGSEEREYELEPEIELPLNRRFQIELEPEYVWIDGRDGEPDGHGPTWSARAALQGIDTSDTALNAQLGIEVPSGGDLEERRTDVNLALAGFRDLGARIGVQAHVGVHFLLGSGDQEDDPDRELDYAIALTKTVTDETPGFAHVTAFLEGFGKTELDGRHAGRTHLTLLPGLRFEIGWGVWLGAGVELPVTEPREFYETYHVAIIKEIE